MARLYTAGAEYQSRQAEGVVFSGTVNYVSTPVHSGAFAYAFPDATLTYLRTLWTRTTNRWFYGRGWFRVTALPSVETEIATIYDGASLAWPIKLGPTGTIRRTAGGGTIPTSAAVAVNEWHCLEIGVWGDGTTTRRITLRLDGTQWEDFSTTSAFATLGDAIRWGWPGGGPNTGSFIYYDDIALNDETGSQQNSWPGHLGKIVRLAPVADVAVGNWNLGTGTTTGNRWDAVDNVPPVGVANTTGGSDAKQIRNNVASTTRPASDVDLRLEAYSSKLPVGATVTVVQSQTALGTSNSTTPSDYESGLLSSPSETPVAGTLPLQTAGNYSTAWLSVIGASVHSPSVALSDQPVIRVSKRSAITQALMCCSMGLTVEYEEARGQPFLAVA